jgi:hypothetical protein
VSIKFHRLELFNEMHHCLPRVCSFVEGKLHLTIFDINLPYQLSFMRMNFSYDLEDARFMHRLKRIRSKPNKFNSSSVHLSLLECSR